MQNVKEKWIQELKKSHKEKAAAKGAGRKRGKLPPVILVGTQSDLREDARTLLELGRAKEHPASLHLAMPLEPPVVSTVRKLV